MLSFDEIEMLMPEDEAGCYCRDSDGAIVSSAAWLHKFAQEIAAHERESCAKLLERYAVYGQEIPRCGKARTPTVNALIEMSRQLRTRSN